MDFQHILIGLLLVLIIINILQSHIVFKMLLFATTVFLAVSILNNLGFQFLVI